MKIETTKNYSMFNRNKDQRPIMQSHVKRLAENMAQVGFLPSKPIQCYRNGGKLVVVDGHHRLEAAKLVEIPVCYIVEQPSCQQTMASENYLVKGWKQIDFVRLYASRHDRNYMTLLAYRDLGIPICMAASMMINNSASSGNATESVQDGTFKIKSTDQIEKVAGLIREFGSLAPVVSSRPFIAAISKCILCGQFSLETFKDRLRENFVMLTKTSNEDQMLSVIETIYNHRSRNPVAVKFYAQSAARERNAYFKRCKNVRKTKD